MKVVKKKREGDMKNKKSKMVKRYLMLVFMLCILIGSINAANLFTEDVEDWTGQQSPGFAYYETYFGSCPNAGRSSTYAHGGTYSLAGCVGGAGWSTWLKMIGLPLSRSAMLAAVMYSRVNGVDDG